ncbi:endonuclease Q family protein [Heyndrickxia acidicola]|uniref:Endonuclease Q family protein n=1 Tax=Heyndrickxia acidicola TaxID=209389 RepID=A0ABU6MKR9_9BACI|nr:endonuclease Q family protein [Heyndrickxia acidicola]MED1204948.1 endonuclease Q family protein [Heyndrickxia acidicola]
MKDYFVDLHIHIGRTKSGKPVKITGSKSLTLSNILKAAKFPKGLDIVGVIDCHSPEVIMEMEELLEKSLLEELSEGGFRFEESVTLIPGVEIEVKDENCKGPIHVLGYFPNLESLKHFSKWYGDKVTNVHLSTQRIRENARTLQEKIISLGGIFIPAHVFTPFKSVYGKGVKTSLTEIFNPSLVDAVELGLSSDSAMADHISELHDFTFVTNSDAHSLGKMAREYQIMHLNAPDFNAVKEALHRQKGHKVVANYGLNPLLGKYYKTVCSKCLTPKEGDICPRCGSKQFTKGVSERISELSDSENGPVRPPYIHQVPLDFLPGLGKKTMDELLNHFGTEMHILHCVPKEELKKIIKPELAALIIMAREGRLHVLSGGGGRYGRISPL